MQQKGLNIAVDELCQTAEATAKLHGVSAFELLVFAAAYALMPHMTRDDAAKQFAEARANLVKAGMKEKE